MIWFGKRRVKKISCLLNREVENIGVLSRIFFNLIERINVRIL